MFPDVTANVLDRKWTTGGLFSTTVILGGLPEGDVCQHAVAVKMDYFKILFL